MRCAVRCFVVSNEAGLLHASDIRRKTASCHSVVLVPPSEPDVEKRRTRKQHHYFQRKCFIVNHLTSSLPREPFCIFSLFFKFRFRWCFGKLSLGYFVDGEADGVQRGSCAALSPPALLHERHHHGAALFPIILLIVVLLGETQPILRVCPEGVCVTMDKKDLNLIETPRLI